MRINNGTCEACSPGSFSVGGGERIVSWNPLPARFISQCDSTGCTKWIGAEDGLETVTSGNGNSTLSATFDFVVDGSIGFQYKVWMDTHIYTYMYICIYDN